MGLRDGLRPGHAVVKTITMNEYKILDYFKWEHLPKHLQDISKPFCELAFEMAVKLPKNGETITCLRKLLEAKDCAVRSAV